MMFQTILILMLVIAIPISGIIFKRLYVNNENIYVRKYHYMANITLTLSVMCVILLALKLDKVKLSTIGLTTVKHSILSSNTAIVCMVVSVLLIILNYYSTLNFEKLISNEQITKEQKIKMIKMLPATKVDRLYFVVIAFSAGIGEEIIYRGFLSHYISNVININGVWLIILVSIVFALAHVMQGASGAFNVFIVSILWTSISLATGSLIIPMILHTIFDLKLCLSPYSGNYEKIKQQLNDEKDKEKLENNQNNACILEKDAV